MPTDFATFEKTGWSRREVAREYAATFASAAEMCVPPMVAAVGAGQGTAALDLCTGHGIVARALAQMGADVTALDFSPAMLEMAARNAPGVRLVEGDATALPFADASFDAVTMGFGMLHVADPEKAVAEAARVLRPGGRFAYSCWLGPEQTESVLPVVLGTAQRLGDLSKVDLPPSDPAWHYAAEENARPLLEGAGLREVEMHEVAAFWTCDEPHEPVDIFRDATVRGAALLSKQPEEQYRAIAEAVADWVRSKCEETDGGWHVPLPAAVWTARKP